MTEYSCEHTSSCSCKQEVKHIPKKDRLIMTILIIVLGIIFLRPLAVRALYISAINFYGIGYEDKAILKLKKSLRLDPKFGLAYEELGNIYEDKGDIKKAMLFHKKAISADPLVTHSYTTLAKIYFRDKNYQKVVETCNSLVSNKKTNKEHIIALKFLCFSYEKLQDKKNEKACWEKILFLQPKDGLAKWKIGN